MDYLKTMAISSTGMAAEKLRLETVAENIANMYSSQRGGAVYKPKQVVSGQRLAVDFSTFLNPLEGARDNANAPFAEVKELELAPKMVYQPDHPHADGQGYVAYPNINPVNEMLTLIEASRAYEANVQAVNAAKSMALRALEIGGKK